MSASRASGPSPSSVRSSSTRTTSSLTRRLVISGLPRAGRSACAMAPVSLVTKLSPKSDEVVEVRCHHVPDSVGKNPPGVKVSGVIHWVPATLSVPAEVRLYDHLFSAARPDDGVRRRAQPRLSRGGTAAPASSRAWPAPSRQPLAAGTGRLFRVRRRRLPTGAPVFNRIVTLRDSGRANAAAGAGPRPKPARTTTRPPKRSRIEYRAEARVQDPLLADRFATWPRSTGWRRATPIF